MTRAALLGRSREGKGVGEPGCGKKLDSAAKSDGDGGIWCRECLVSKFLSLVMFGGKDG